MKTLLPDGVYKVKSGKMTTIQLTDKGRQAFATWFADLDGKTPDYRSMLVRYIAHVGSMEGVDFIHRYEGDMADAGFSETEIAMMKQLSAETK